MTLQTDRQSGLTVMEDEKRFIRSWVIFGMIAGLFGDLAYFLASAPIPLPDLLDKYIGFAFGPLLSLAFVGFYYFFKLHRKSVAMQAAALFGIIAGTLVNLMIVVQSALVLTVPREARADLGLAWDGLNMVQLGMDVSWDIYISLATILLGIAMLAHPRFGFVWGGISILVGGGLLILNLATFPIPPASADSFDLGPVLGAWYAIIAIRVLVSRKWVDERLAGMESKTGGGVST